MSRHRFGYVAAITVVLIGAAAARPAASGASPSSSGAISAVTVGAKGNEPIVKAAPDGTLYISALQYIYRSRDHGASWTQLPGPVVSTVNLASDSSISVDPGGRLYFTDDYPYAGTTAVCTSDDQGNTFACNPAVVPGGTDRMWVLAPSTTSAYETTNEGLYETAFLVSHDRGMTFVPTQFTSNFLQPQTGPLIQKSSSSLVLQSLNDGNTNLDSLYVWDPSGASVTQAERSSPLPLPNSLPSDAMDQAGNVWLASEKANPQGGREVVTAYSPDEGQHWTQLPPIPQTFTGTATFTAVAAGSAGHVGVLYYSTTDNGDPNTLTNSTWSTVYAETFNATAATPTWTVTTVDPGVHQGPICFAAGCMGNSRFSGDFITATMNPHDLPLLTWNKDMTGNGTTSTVVRFGAASNPTVARVSRFAVITHPATVTFTWQLAVPQGIAGFDLYAGSHRLNRRPVPVHAGKTYRYAAHWRERAPYSLHVLLTDGRQVVVER